uniref:CP-type G domain-containing protein n=1 Tax=Leersia perrieri TaxID=77586 RepID=A0A0D9Y1I6_9ORYZ
MDRRGSNARVRSPSLPISLPPAVSPSGAQVGDAEDEVDAQIPRSSGRRWAPWWEGCPRIVGFCLDGYEGDRGQRFGDLYNRTSLGCSLVLLLTVVSFLIEHPRKLDKKGPVGRTGLIAGKAASKIGYCAQLEACNGPQVSECSATSLDLPKKNLKKKDSPNGRKWKKCTLLRDARGRFLPRESNREDTEESTNSVEFNKSCFMDPQAPDFATILSIVKGRKSREHCNRIRRLKDPDFVSLMDAMNNTGCATVDDGPYDVVKKSELMSVILPSCICICFVIHLQAMAGGGGGGKKEKGEGLGRALIRQRNKAAAAVKERGDALAYARRKAQPLESVIEVSDIDAVLERAAEADRLHSALADAAASVSSSSDLVIDLDATGETDEERRRMQKEQEALHATSLRVPRRPPWNSRMTVEELDENERRAFLVWRRNLARLEENDKLVLTPFEKNIDIWRQLWRVLERSDLLVMVVDARDPLFYRCPDLELYAKEIDEHKRTMLLVNKADLLPMNIRKKWADYFKARDILYVFWSAKAATATLEGKQLGGYSEQDSASLDLDTKIYGRDELLKKLQTEAEFIVAQRRAAATKEDRKTSSDSVSSVAKHVVVGFVGYPNVGKSSTINALVGEKKTGVTHTPGKTKHFQTLIISEELTLCDCPGLVFPSFSSSRHEMVSCGVLPIDRMTKHREAIQVVADRVPRSIVEEIYKITLPKPKPYESQSRPPTAAELLRAYCASRGHVSHAGLPDETRAARQILKDYIDGKIPHFELPPGVEDEMGQEGTTVTEGPTTSAPNESDGPDSDEDEQDDTTDPAQPDIRHVLRDLESFDLATEGSKSGGKKKKEASHKQHKKPQRKKDRSWRVGNDGGDGTAVVRVYQKPAVNLSTVSASERI